MIRWLNIISIHSKYDVKMEQRLGVVFVWRATDEVTFSNLITYVALS